MASQGPLYAGSGADGGGPRAWTNPGNITASDNTYASYPAASSGDTNGLDATNFGFTIPSGVTVTGVVVEVECHSSFGSNIGTSFVKLLLAGVPSGTDNSDGATWTAGDTTLTYGADGNTFGLALTDSDVNASGFGVRIKANISGSALSAFVDSVRMTVYYSGGSTYSLAASSGSYALAGTAVALEQGHKVSVTAGSYALSGTAVVLTHGHPLTVSAGAYTLSGSDVTLVAPFRLTVAPGAYSVTGSTVALKWGHRVIVAAGSYALVGGPAFPVSVTTEDSGVCGVQGSFTSECSGVFRLANDIAGYNLYVGEDALPDFDAAPAAFSATLPVSLVITPPGVGTKTLYATVRKQDKYGLESRNQRTTRFRINTSGDLVRLPLSSVVGLQVAERQGGYVRVLATYPAFADEDDPPSHWKVWAGNTEPDIGVDAPAIQSTMSAVFAGQVGPFSPGIVYVKVVAWRNVDAVSSPTASASLTLSATPDRPVAVRGGYDEP